MTTVQLRRYVLEPGRMGDFPDCIAEREIGPADDVLGTVPSS